MLAADDARRALLTEVEELRARQNAASKEIGKAAPDERPAKIAAAAALKEELTRQEPELADADDTRPRARAAGPEPGRRVGARRRRGRRRGGAQVVGDTPAPPALDHAAFGEAMGFVETEHARRDERVAVRVADRARRCCSSSRSCSGSSSRLVGEGFTPVVPPVLVREHAMEEAGFFPTDRSQVYEVDDGELFLVGTSEVPLSALHRGEILDADDAAAPLRGHLVVLPARGRHLRQGHDRASSACTSSTRWRCSASPTPTTSWDEHERILAIEESIVGGLGLPYRVVNIAAGDLGAAAAKKYDIEVWLPSEGATASSRRARTTSTSRPAVCRPACGTTTATELVHTLNGTACAIGRTLVFLFEHYQDADGGFVVPERAAPVTGFDRVEPPT